jgi:PAS domain S-box-containing protein
MGPASSTTIHQSAELFRSLLESSPDAIVVSDSSGLIQLVNARTVQLFGYSRQELIGHSVNELVPDEPSGDRDVRRKKVLDDSRTTPTQGAVTMAGRRRDGSAFPLDVSFSALQVNGDQLIISAIRDATDRTLAEQRLAEAREIAKEEQRLASEQTETLFNLSPDMVGMAGPDGHFIRLNPVWEATLGWTQDELLAKPYLSLVHPEDRKRTLREFENLAHGARTVNFTNRCACRDGSYLRLDWSLASDVSGHTIYLFARDVTEANRLRLELNEKAALTDLAHDAIIVLNPEDGRVRYWNDGAEAMYGYTADEAVGHVSANLLKTLGPAAMGQMIANGAGSDRWEGRVTQTTKAGAHLVVDARWAVLRDVSGPVGRVLEINRDVTALVHAEKALQHVNDSLELRVRERTAELESFSYSVSHDLRTPLRALNGFVDVLVEEMPGQLNADSQDALAEIRSNAIRMGHLIDDLLAFSRLGNKDLEKRLVDMTGQARRSSDGLAILMQGRSIELDIRQMPTCMGDPGLLAVIWTNLLANAIKFTDGRAPAQITAGAEMRDGKVVYFVRDNGVGFDMAHAGNLFGVFQRLHAADEFEGTGIGLATVKRICMRHGGTAWAEAVLDQGATLYFTVGGAEQ